MLVDKLLLYCISHGMVVDDDIPMLRYCIEKNLYTIVTFIPLVAVGILIAGSLITVSFLVTFMYLRQMTNGYHAKTPGRCFAWSLLLETLILDCAQHDYPFWAILIMTAISALIIWNSAPYAHPNMNYSANEILACRVLSRKRVLIVISIMTAFYLIHQQRIIVGMCFGLNLAAGLLGFAIIMKQRS